MTTKAKSKAEKKREAATLLGEGEELPEDLREVPPPLPKDLVEFGELRFLIETYYSTQNHRIKSGNRLGALNRTLGIPEDRLGRLQDWVTDRMSRMEREVQYAVKRMLRNHELWSSWLEGVKGVGPCIAGGLIAWLGGPHYTAISKEQYDNAEALGWEVADRIIQGTEDEDDDKQIAGYYRVRQGIGAFDSISKLWTYCGVGLTKDGQVQKRRKGERSNWKPELKTLAWKIGESFVRSGRGYRELYDQSKQRLLMRPDQVIELSAPDWKLLGRTVADEALATKHSLKKGEGGGDPIITAAVLKKLRDDADIQAVSCGWRAGHVDRQARRWTAKVFLAHVWKRWRELEGLPTELPYIIGKDGHTTEIEVIEE